MARIIKAAMGYAAIPAGFPILVSERMVIIEPAFAWLMELATIPGRSHAAETIRTYGEHLHDWFDSLEQSGLNWRGGRRGGDCGLAQPHALTAEPAYEAAIRAVDGE